MTRYVFLPALVGALALCLGPAFAQDSGQPTAPEPDRGDQIAEDDNASTPKDGAVATDNAEGKVRTEESAILPNGEDQDESAAETMDIDCEEDPDNCLDPVTQPIPLPDLSTPDDIDTPEVETGEAAPVVAEPEQ